MNILTRMFGAARLDPHTYEELEADSSAMPQALLVVVIVAVFTGIGEVIRGDATLINAVITGAIRGVGLWAAWALVAWMIGSTVLRTPETQADWGQLARGTGFAQTPGLLSIFAFLPGIGFLISTVVFFWQFAGMVIALRQSLDYSSSLRAFIVVLLSAIPVFIIWIVLAISLDVFEGSVT